MKTIYERKFGLKPLVIAAYPFGTKQGGGIMHPEVVEAMKEAAPYNVNVVELLERAGQKIAEMVGAEAAFITSGACAGLTLASAATMTGLDVRLMEQLPNTEYPVKMKNEIIMQMGHVTHYVGCLKAPGARIVEVGGGYLPRGPMAGATWEEFKEVHSRV
jgi:L-seryl-tRNA(Ser) seleniumtransferase